jgi:tetratricopeptide (TPR) repeat protein
LTLANPSLVAPPVSSADRLVRTATGDVTAILTSSISAELTEEGAVLGTVGYIAPEHIFTGADDARSDQFSFCVTMYLVLYGKHPFAFRDLSSYIEALEKSPEPPPSSTRVPGWIHDVIEQGLRREPDRRFASMDDLLAALERDPSRRRRMWALGTVAVVAVLGGTVGWARHQAQLRSQCAQGPTLIAAAWNPEVERNVRGALERAGGPYGPQVAQHVADRLGQYAQTWAATYRTVAEATLLRGEQGVTIMDRRVRCLEQGREQLRALTEVLSQADAAVVQRAIDAAYALPASTSCATSDVANLPALPSSPELRARVLEAERTISRASALGNAGQDAQAEAIVERALPEVRAIPHPRIEAELLMLQARCKQQRGDNRGAFPVYQDALRAAERAGDDLLAARAAARAAFLLSGWLNKPQEGEQWIDLADAIAERAGRNDAIDVDILASRIVVKAMLGHPEQAIALHDKEIAARVRLYGERDPRVATAITNRGVTRQYLGQSDLALEDFRRGTDLLESLSGAANPHLALGYSNLSDMLNTLGRAEEARTAAQHALDLQAGERPGGVTVLIYSGIAAAEIQLGHLDAALLAANKGLAAADEIGENGRNKWLLLTLRADARGKAGDLAGELEDCSEVLALQKARGPLTSDSPYGPDALTCLGETELALHRVEPAISYLEQSVALEHRGEPWELPTARFALARALRVAGRQPARAEELARNALDALRPLRGQEPQVATIERWLDGGPAAR